MYHPKTPSKPGDIGATIIGAEPAPIDCFGDKATAWVYLLSVMTAILLGVGGHQFVTEWGRQKSMRRTLTNPAAWTTAYRPCPYDSGSLDRFGRCNIAGCPLHVGAAPVAVPAQTAPDLPPAAAPPEAAFIPGLAMEAGTTADGTGVLVEIVYAGGPAEAAGLVQGDAITRFNGRRVRSLAHFQDIVTRAAPESSVVVVFLRGGAILETSVIISEGEFTPPVQPALWGRALPDKGGWVQ